MFFGAKLTWLFKFRFMIFMINFRRTNLDNLFNW